MAQTTPQPTSTAPLQKAESILRARNIQRSFKMGDSVVQVLKGCDLTLREGEFVAIEGRSGSGKSTLLHIMGALDECDGGSVEFEGQDFIQMSSTFRSNLRNKKFGFIFQFYHLLPELSAVENVMLPHMIRDTPASYWPKRKKIRAEATALLERVGLGHRLTHRPNELSGGEMQRAAIARALAGGPEILLADEPTGNLDTASGQSVLELLRDLNRERGLTMMMVTHDLTIAHGADRVVRLAEGRIEEWAAALA
jgi:lipoprotein-releasing system ATP-binding protein